MEDISVVDITTFSCPSCTIDLAVGTKNCYMCGSLISKSVSSSSKKNNVTCFKCRELGHYANECPFNITKPKNSSNRNENHPFEDIVSGCESFQSSTAVDGIIELMKESLESCVHNQFRICSPLPHISQISVEEGSNWSCGYRNIQMLCCSLVKIEKFRRILFNGTGDIPDIFGIQTWIEKAWIAGFDEEGSRDFNRSLLGSRDWIGATECASLLRYFGVNAVVVDFFKHTNNYHDVPLRLKNWTKKYFDSFETQKDKSILPLYFQHEGHSRTIIGYEINFDKRHMKSKIDSDDFSLLLFDPSSNGKSIKSNLLAGTNSWKSQVKRGLHTLKKTQYQIVYIVDEIMNENMRNKSKILVGVQDNDPIIQPSLKSYDIDNPKKSVIIELD